jgi:hypothetical protein
LNAAKKIILLLWLLIVASLGNASASTPGATENRVWQKSLATIETRQAEPTQTADRHQKNGVAGYDYAVDCLLAAEGTVASKPFAMGLDAELDSFAQARGASTWKQFPDAGNWKSGVLDKLADPNTPVHFNLNGVDVWSGVQRAASGGGGATDWELLQLRQNPQFWDSTTFWKNGQVAPNPFKP